MARLGKDTGRKRSHLRRKIICNVICLSQPTKMWMDVSGLVSLDTANRAESSNHPIICMIGWWSITYTPTIPIIELLSFPPPFYSALPKIHLIYLFIHLIYSWWRWWSPWRLTRPTLHRKPFWGRGQLLWRMSESFLLGSEGQTLAGAEIVSLGGKYSHFTSEDSPYL